MPTVVQFRRGTTSQNNSFTGAVGEISIDTTLSTIRVHDGATAGGATVVTTSSAQTLNNKTIPVISGVTVVTGNLVANSGTASTTTTSGALVVAGGIGASGALNIGGAITSGAITSSGTIIASILNAGTIGNASAVLYGTLNSSSASQPNVTTLAGLTSFGTAGVTTTAAGNFTITGCLTVNGTTNTINNTTIETTEYVQTIDATTVRSATLGNIGANVIGTGTYLTSLAATNVNGTVATANVSLYDSFTATSTNATFYPQLFDKTTGNGSGFTASTLTHNPSTGTLSATTVSATTLTGTLSTAAQTNITSVGTLTGLTVSGAIVPNANVSINLGSTSAWWNIIYGKATQAQYADLAENYQADAEYEPGTVLVFGGSNEVTTTTESHDARVAGVVSTNPAHLMNGGLQGENVVALGLTGRLPCRVQGPVAKGTVLVTSAIPGVAQAIDNSQFRPGCVLGKALESINTNSIDTIEIVVGRF